MIEKTAIRKEIKQLKSQLTGFDKHQASTLVFQKLYELNEWKDSNHILVYHSLPDELQTIDFLANTSGKSLYLPKIVGNELMIVKYNPNELESGSFNILEPSSDDYVCPKNIDLVIVPGIAFDHQKNRLGRGKGYYDKLLTHTEAIKIGICYDFQLLESVPTSSHDIKMDIIISPNTTIL